MEIDPLDFVLENQLSASKDPVGFVFLPIIIGAVLTWLVGRCLDAFFLGKANKPSFMARLRLQRICKKAARYAEDAQGNRLSADDQEIYANQAYTLLLQAGKAAREEHVEALRRFQPKTPLKYDLE